MVDLSSDCDVALWDFNPFGVKKGSDHGSDCADRSGLHDAASNNNGKATPATPKVNKSGRTGSTRSETGSPSPATKASSPSPKPRLPVMERSPKSAESKTPNKANTTPDKPPRTPKGSELQTKLDVVVEELKNAREQLATIQQEKGQIAQELTEAKRAANEANDKLAEAIAASKQAEEKLEIEKFRADELEQASIEASKKNEEKYQKELESLKNQHDLDVSALLSVTEELQKVKLDLSSTMKEKIAALSEADDTKKVAEMNGEKVELLSGEVNRLKALLDSKLDDMNKESAEMIKKLDAEVNSLKLELERAKATEEKLTATTTLVEQLQTEMSLAKKAESDALKLVDEWKNKVAALEIGLEKADLAEKSVSETLKDTMKRLEESSILLQDSEAEITTLRGKAASLEIEVAKYRSELEESDKHIDLAQQEAASLGKTIELLKTELQKQEEEKLEAEKVATSNIQRLMEEKNKLVDELTTTLEEAERVKKSMESDIQNLLEEKNKLIDELNSRKKEEERVKETMTSDMQILLEEKDKLIDELNTSRDEVERVKKAMEGLATALQEMSSESREHQERILTKQAEIEDARSQVEKLNSTLENTEERYQVMLDEARYEIVCLKKTVERYETDANNSSTEWETKEMHFVNAIKRSEDELSSLKVEMEKVVESLKVAEQEAQEAKADGVDMLNKLRSAEAGANAAYEMAEGAKAESLQLKETLLDKENELQSISQENDDLRIREAAALQKISELSALLAEATSKRNKENGDLNSTVESDTLPKSSELQDKSRHEKPAERYRSDGSSEKLENHYKDNQKTKEENNGNHNNLEEDQLEVLDKDLASERDHEAESIDDDLDSKIDDSISDHMHDLTGSRDNGSTSPTKHPKKKKAFMHKFGSLLKKKGSVKY